MGGNLLLEQYGRFKKAELEESPFRCLLNANIEINPHQINAFCAAIQALKTGGIVLADEVGLGKTIEAGLTLKYVLDSGAKHVLIALPATLRKQWEVELEEKFNLQASILDRLTVESNLSFWKACLENRDEVRIVITSYDYSSKLMQRFSNVKWDFIIIDEAHNLRNVFHGTKRAKRLYELSKGIPKILLTATPLQNSLSDLHGLISFIDPRIFGSEKVFNKRFIEGQDYTELKRELIPVLYRTLRRDVGKYMDFKKRECRTIDFVLSPDEVELYMRVNNFLKKDAGVKSFAEINTNTQTQKELYAAYLKAFGATKKKESDSYGNEQMTLDQLFDVETGEPDKKNDETSETLETTSTISKGKKPLSKDEFVQKIKEYSGKAISVPKILVQTTSEVKFKRFVVKRTIPDFEVAMAKIERFDAINQQLLTAVDAQILEVDDALNTLACMLLDSISELSYEDADFIIDVVEQYLAQIEGDEEDKRKIVRRYASLIVSDIRKQIFEHTERKTEDIHIVQKDLILFRKFVKNVKKDGRVRFDKPFTDKSNIKKYLFTGYKKAYYTENAFDSDTERLFSIILEEDPDVIRWIKPPLNQLGLFWQAGQQYNPDFLVETTSGKFMVEVKASNEVTADDVVAKAREGIKWCHFASTADPDHKVWEYRLISDDNIKLGNTCKYTLGTAHRVEEG